MANTLISATDMQNLHDAVIVDCRSDLMNPDAGALAYQAAHIPGAHFADLNQDLSAPVQPGVTGRHPLPDNAELIRFIRQLGITNHTPVIAYDADMGAYAARFWWLMRSLGHDQVWILNGGFKAWLASGGQPTSQPGQPELSEFVAKPAITQTLTAEDITGTNYTLLDARAKRRFYGQEEPIDPVAGHIPGAACFPFQNNLDENGLALTMGNAYPITQFKVCDLPMVSAESLLTKLSYL